MGNGFCAKCGDKAEHRYCRKCMAEFGRWLSRSDDYLSRADRRGGELNFDIPVYSHRNLKTGYAILTGNPEMYYGAIEDDD